jgi:ABC-type uncharacterized transport system involved in gliding motility auxiliary subunit
VLGLLGWLGVALVFAAVAIRFLKPEWQQWYNGLAMGGLGCTLLYILSQWREVARSFSGRQVRFGTLAAASILVVLAIMVAINYLSSRHNKRWDLTAAKQFSLSDQTKKVLTDLKTPVRVLVFDRSDNFERFRDRLAEYEYTSPNFKVEYMDVDKKPQIANQYQVQSLGTVIFEYQGRTEKVTSDSEQDLTNALIKVLSGKNPKVYFVQGHGEHSPDDTDQRTSYSTIGAALTSENFQKESLVLAQVKEIPADASVLIVAGPKTDFLTPEVELLKTYLGKGGKILFMIDPPDKAETPDPANIVALLKDWAIDVGRNVVVDVSGMGQLFGTGASVPVAAKYNAHPITDRFRLMTAFPLARSVSAITAGVNSRYATELVTTSANSWAESDLKGLMTSGEVTRDLDKGDKGGPIALGAAVSAAATTTPPPADPAKPDDTPKPETRMAVFGDSDFVSNAYLGIPGNKDLFLNTVNWLAHQENLISIRPRDPEDRRLSLTSDQLTRIFWLTVLIIPGLIILTGVQTWWRRR